MAINMRFLYTSGKKKFVTIGDIIKAKYGLQFNAIDVIPPAYSCDKVRLLVLGITIKDEPVDKVRLFCRELTKARAQNVSLIIDGNEKGANVIVNILKEAGTNVNPDILYIKGGLPFLGNLNDEEKASLDKWLDKCVETLV